MNGGNRVTDDQDLAARVVAARVAAGGVRWQRRRWGRRRGREGDGEEALVVDDADVDPEWETAAVGGDIELYGVHGVDLGRFRAPLCRCVDHHRFANKPSIAVGVAVRGRANVRRGPCPEERAVLNPKEAALDL